MLTSDVAVDVVCAHAQLRRPGGDMMQAPAAPQHELMVQEDGRDWALEQMSQAAAPGTASPAQAPPRGRPLFEDISAGEGLECLLRGCSKWGPYSILSGSQLLFEEISAGMGIVTCLLPLLQL